MNFAERLKSARGSLGLKQTEMSEQSGVSYRAYQHYEGGRSLPCADALMGFMQLGINANWLLTGEGPMLLADLVVVREVVVEKEVVRQVAPPINAAALGAILAGILQARGSNADPTSAAKQAIKFYHEAINEGLITPTGIGNGGEKAA